MPPNKKGGKNYKKGKHTDDEPVLHSIQGDQMYGRVLKLLGGCNTIVYCNDGYERICHIRGSMRKKVWIATGDIVLISIRDMETVSNKSEQRGDICAKYDQRVIQKLKNTDDSINPKLFLALEKADTEGAKVITEQGFVFEASDGEDGSEDSSSGSEVEEAMRPANRVLQKRATMMNDDDFNVDDI